MLASAGADSSIDSVDDLQVDPSRVWASEAQGDWAADFGRAWPFSEHQNNPTDASFGANVFSSETANLDGRQLEGSDGHHTTPHANAGSRASDSTPYGYLDKYTTPLYNSAIASLGLDRNLMARPSGGGGGR
jgi:hypothetical protein